MNRQTLETVGNTEANIGDNRQAVLLENIFWGMK